MTTNHPQGTPASFPTPTEPAPIPYTEKVDQELKEISERSAFHANNAKPREQKIEETNGTGGTLVGIAILLILFVISQIKF